LDERGRRLFVAAEKAAAGYGGTAAVSRATGVAHSTIIRGAKDLLTTPRRRTGCGARAPAGRLIEQGGPDAAGGPATIARAGDDGRSDAAVAVGLQEPRQAGGTALREMGHKVSSAGIPKLLGELKYCRHFNRKTKEGGKHPDRDGQFEYINAKVEAFQAADQPVISIDAKKKELLGEFKNGGSDYGPQGQPIEVNTHDFEDKDLGKVVPYGIYDIGANLGYVSLGIDHDTGQFAVNAVRRWLDGGLETLPRNDPADDHRRWRRLQRFTPAAVEAGIATTRR
jgi:hypothetical protein